MSDRLTIVPSIHMVVLVVVILLDQELLTVFALTLLRSFQENLAYVLWGTKEILKTVRLSTNVLKIPMGVKICVYSTNQEFITVPAMTQMLNFRVLVPL